MTILAGLIASTCDAGTLREALLKEGVAVTSPQAPADLDRAITSYAVENEADQFAVAYYWLGETDQLPDTFRISVLDKASGAWTHAELPSTTDAYGAPFGIGSLLQIHHTGQRIYLDTHANPSAGTLLVLNRQLQPVAALNGWLELVFPNDTVVYQHSMVHFSSTHPAELWVYEPEPKRNIRLYPNKPYQPVRRAYMKKVKKIYEDLGEDWFRVNNHHMDPELFDTSISPEVVGNDAGTSVAFLAQFGDLGSSPASTPVQEVLVVCRNIASTRARCTEKELDPVRRSHPGWTDLQILNDAVGR